MATEFFVSDIHGEYAQFVSNLKAAEAFMPQVAFDKLHVIGDIYDRGPAPDSVVEMLMDQPNLDIQWGNHDIVWMGASLGQRACVATVVRICARYNNLPLLEDTYRLDLSSLRRLANTVYADDPCELFIPKGTSDMALKDRLAIARIQKAIAIIQFKVEYTHSIENPSFDLTRRNLLHCIDFEAGTVEIEGESYPMLDMNFPTVDPADPYALTAEEETVIDNLVREFKSSRRLQRHIRLFLDAGSLYTISGDALLFHAAVPLNEDGSLKKVRLFDQTLKGRALFNSVENYVRDAFGGTCTPREHQRGRDLLWYLWLGEGSPLFDKSKMATFELYFVADKAVREEHKNPFYTLMEKPQAITAILEDFGMDPETGRIICGHVPVKVKDGESPVKCDGHAIVIDGGMSRAYQGTTGIAGYTLVKDNNDVWRLITHQPLGSFREPSIHEL